MNGPRLTFRRSLAAVLLAAVVGVAAELGWLAGSARRPPAPAAGGGPADPVWPVDRDPVLDRPVPRLELTEATVDEAVDAVRRAAAVNVVNLNGPAWTPVVEPRPITLRLTDVTAATALRAILAQAGATDPAIAARDGVIFVGRTDEPVVRVYDVRALAGARWAPGIVVDVAHVDSADPPSPADPPGTDSSARNAPAAGGGTEELTWMIRTGVARQSWADHGGVGVLWEWNGVLVVCQTPENHEKIARFLRSLRRATAAAAATGGPTTRP